MTDRVCGFEVDNRPVVVPFVLVAEGGGGVESLDPSIMLSLRAVSNDGLTVVAVIVDAEEGWGRSEATSGEGAMGAAPRLIAR